MSNKRVSTAGELSRELQRLYDVFEDDFVQVIRKLSFDAFTMVVSLTPEDTGFAQSNWKVALNASVEGSLYHPGGSNYPAARYGDPGIEFGDNVHIYNNTVYIGALEHGWSKKAPQGMVEPTYSALTTWAKQNADRLSQKRM